MPGGFRWPAGALCWSLSLSPRCVIGRRRQSLLFQSHDCPSETPPLAVAECVLLIARAGLRPGLLQTSRCGQVPKIALFRPAFLLGDGVAPQISPTDVVGLRPCVGFWGAGACVPATPQPKNVVGPPERVGSLGG